MGVNGSVDLLETRLTAAVQRHRANHRHQREEHEGNPRLSPGPEGPLDAEEEQRDDEVELLFGGERPSAAHLSLDVVGQEREVRPDAVPLPEGEREERDPGEVQRPDPHPSSKEEPRHVHRVTALQLPLELPSDEEAGEDEEQVDAGPAVPEEREPPDRGRGQLGAADGEVIADHQDDGGGPERVEGRKGAGWRDDE